MAVSLAGNKSFLQNHPNRHLFKSVFDLAEQWDYAAVCLIRSDTRRLLRVEPSSRWVDFVHGRSMGDSYRCHAALASCFWAGLKILAPSRQGAKEERLGLGRSALCGFAPLRENPLPHPARSAGTRGRCGLRHGVGLRRSAPPARKARLAAGCPRFPAAGSQRPCRSDVRWRIRPLACAGEA